MQTLEDKRAFNREKAQEWRTNNIDRARIIRWQSKRRSLGLSDEISLYVPKALMPKKIKVDKIRVSHAKSIEKTTVEKPKTIESYQIKTPVGLCEDCARKYLLPLGCLFCK